MDVLDIILADIAAKRQALFCWTRKLAGDGKVSESAQSAPIGLARGLIMQGKLSESEPLLGPLEYHSLVPVEPTAASQRLGWTGLAAARFSDLADAEFERPALTHHSLILFTGAPDELDLRYEDVKRYRPPPLGSVSVVPAGIPTRWRWRGTKSSFHVYLEPGLVERVAADAFGLDRAAGLLPPLDALANPQLAAAMRAVDAELTAGGVGGSLASESLANLLAVHLIRHLVAPGRAVHGRDGTLPRGRLRAVLKYIEEHLDAAPTLRFLPWLWFLVSWMPSPRGRLLPLAASLMPEV